jgi:uncharacterized lipoprotein YmbA
MKFNMRQRIFPLVPALAAAVLVLSGCVQLKPQPDETEFFLLAADVAPPERLTGDSFAYVARVEVPGYLEGNRIYRRSTGGRLESVTGARWAQAPAEALPQALALHLEATGRTQVSAYYPSPKTNSAAATVSVRFERFSARSDGQVEVIARWRVEHPDGSTDSGRYEAATMLWDGAEPIVYVALLDRALAGLAATLAETL